MAEQQRADDRQVAQAGDREARQAIDRDADEARADQRREADAEDRQREAGRDLVGEQGQRQHAERERHQDAGQRAGGDAEAGAAGGHGEREGGHRARQHHALEAEVEHARLLDHELAERGVEQGRRRADDGHQDQDGGIEAHAGAASRRSATQRTRYLVRKSVASRKNSSRPWNTPVTACGRPTSTWAFSPPM